MKKLPSKKRIRKVLSYDPSTGYFVRRTRGGGKPCGTSSKGKYLQIRVDGVKYLTHRLAYVYVYGRKRIKDFFIDHINGDTQDNRICNLRLVTREENGYNRGTAKGYCWSKTHNKWHSQIKIDGWVKHIGYFDNETDARLAYLEVKESLHKIEYRKK